MVAAAGETFFVLTQPYLCVTLDLAEVLRDFDSATEAGQEELLPRLTSSFNAYADAAMTYKQGLISADWPEDVQPSADELIAQLEAAVGVTRLVGQVETLEEYVLLSGLREKVSDGDLAGDPISEISQKLGVKDALVKAVVPCLEDSGY